MFPFNLLSEIFSFSLQQRSKKMLPFNTATHVQNVFKNVFNNTKCTSLVTVRIVLQIDLFLEYRFFIFNCIEKITHLVKQK